MLCWTCFVSFSVLSFLCLFTFSTFLCISNCQPVSSLFYSFPSLFLLRSRYSLPSFSPSLHPPSAARIWRLSIFQTITYGKLRMLFFVLGRLVHFRIKRLVFLVLFVSSIVFGRKILCSSCTVHDMFTFYRPILLVSRAMASIKKMPKPIRKQTMKDNWLNYYHMHRNFRLLPFLYFASVVLYPVNSVDTLKVMTQLSLSCFIGYNIANWYAYKFRFDGKLLLKTIFKWHGKLFCHTFITYHMTSMTNNANQLSLFCFSVVIWAISIKSRKESQLICLLNDLCVFIHFFQIGTALARDAFFIRISWKW